MVRKASEPRTCVRIPVSLHDRIQAGAKKLDIQMMQYVEQAVTLMERMEAQV
jgi:predicted HicB family RNase H-like nuclease